MDLVLAAPEIDDARGAGASALLQGATMIFHAEGELGFWPHLAKTRTPTVRVKPPYTEAARAELLAQLRAPWGLVAVWPRVAPTPRAPRHAGVHALLIAAFRKGAQVEAYLPGSGGCVSFFELYTEAADPHAEPLARVNTTAGRDAVRELVKAHPEARRVALVVQPNPSERHVLSSVPLVKQGAPPVPSTPSTPLSAAPTRPPRQAQRTPDPDPTPRHLHAVDRKPATLHRTPTPTTSAQVLTVELSTAVAHVAQIAASQAQASDGFCLREAPDPRYLRGGEAWALYDALKADPATDPRILREFLRRKACMIPIPTQARDNPALLLSI